MRTVARIGVVLLSAMAALCAAASVQAQENAAPAVAAPAPEQKAPPAVELPAPPPRLPAAVPNTPASPEAAKLEQVRAVMDQAERAPAATATQPPQEFSMYRSSVRVMIALMLVLAVICLLTYILKRAGKQTALLSGPSLATILGKVYLEPRVRLHFVRTGGKVIVVGVTQNAIAPLAEFDAETFTSEPGKANEKVTASASGFMEQLKASMQNMQPRPTPPDDRDADVSALKDDIERLQKYLDDWPGSPKTR